MRHGRAQGAVPGAQNWELVFEIGVVAKLQKM